MKNFECFVGIDWSGAKAPIMTKAISVAKCDPGRHAPNRILRPWSREKIFQWIQGLEKRTLIGIDANFGYAQEIGEKQFGPNYDFKNLWQAVEEQSKDENFFAGGYWNSHPEYFWTQGKKPDHIALPKRLTEITCGEAGYGWPESPFKLLGPKQVGKGGLAAMRMAYHLKKELDDEICIWPFERKIADTARIVVTEIYPRQFLRRSGHGNAKVKTLEGLNTALIALKSMPFLRKQESFRPTQDPRFRGESNSSDFSDHDADALVSAAGLRMLCGNGPQIPENIANPPMLDETRAKREGWIFGVGDI